MNDEEFLAAFEACTLDEFHHRDHIKVAYIYLRRHTPPAPTPASWSRDNLSPDRRRAPILRSGAFPGCHLASKLGVVDVLPLQYKHTYDRTQPIKRPYAVPTLTRALERPVILMVDTNVVTGEIAACAAADLRARWPDSRILFACMTLDVAIESIPGVDELIAVRRTNERRTLSNDAARKAGISSDVYIFPWEELKEQWAEIQAAQSADGPPGRNEKQVIVSRT